MTEPRACDLFPFVLCVVVSAAAYLPMSAWAAEEKLPPILIEALPLHRPIPTFPTSAKLYKHEGGARVRFTIDRMGDVKDVVIESAAGNTLGNASRAAVRGWRFLPAFDPFSCKSHARIAYQDFEYRRSAPDVYEVEMGALRYDTKPGDVPPALVAPDQASLRAKLVVSGREDIPVLEDEPATVIRRAPAFPLAAMPNHLEGFATGRFTIGSDGTPLAVEIVDSEPRGVFELVTREAFLRWRFAPAAKADAPPRHACQRFDYHFKRRPKATLVDDRPIPKQPLLPRLPKEFFTRPMSVQIRVGAMVGADGVPTDVHIIYADPPGVLDQWAIDAVAKWRFEPARKNGRPVAELFEQDMTFDTRKGGQYVRMPRVDEDDRDLLIDTYRRVLDLCPAFYQRTDDEINRTLAAAAAVSASLPLELPHDIQAASVILEHAEACLFSSWEQFRDPDVLETAERFVGRGQEPMGTKDRQYGLIELRERIIAAPDQPTKFDTPGLQEVWKFSIGRLLPVYRPVLLHWTETQPSFPGASADAQAAMDAVRNIPRARYDHRTIKILTDAIARNPAPTDRAYLRLSLANVQLSLGHSPDAVALADAVAEDAAIPLPLRNTARLTLISLAARTSQRITLDTDAVARALRGLNDSLGVADRLTL